MKRTSTLLEEKLIKKGFHLSYKTYKGKHSQFVEFYVYNGLLDNYEVMIYLDRKREKVDHYTIKNVSQVYLGYENIQILENVYQELSSFVYSLSDDYSVEEQEEIVEVVESENE